jgi:metal-responsive CopG/Arc/MetJ family transcriptional regulator
MPERKSRNYNLSITTEVYSTLQKMAERDGSSMSDLLRRAIRLYMYVRTITAGPDARLLVEQNGQIKEIVTDLL